MPLVQQGFEPGTRVRASRCVRSWPCPPLSSYMDIDQPIPEGALLFVWNADSGWQHALMDSLHKVLRPESYPCSLCRLTYGAAGPREAWKRFLKDWDRPAYFLHRDEFRGMDPEGRWDELPLPAVLERRSGQWAPVVSAQTLSGLESLDQLTGLLEKLPRP